MHCIRFYMFYVGDLVTSTREQEIQSVYRRLPDIITPGELTYMFRCIRLSVCHLFMIDGMLFEWIGSYLQKIFQLFKWLLVSVQKDLHLKGWGYLFKKNAATQTADVICLNEKFCSGSNHWRSWKFAGTCTCISNFQSANLDNMFCNLQFTCTC